MQAAAIDVAVEDEGDTLWARRNLRHAEDGRVLLDIANCLRVLELHPDFQGRFKFNDVLMKVLDKGTVMVEWRLFEFAAMIQERFLPEIAQETAARALVVAANKASAK
ncbi:MAG: hypothetical protein AAB227_09570 [Pseudomonadota bacterium]